MIKLDVSTPLPSTIHTPRTPQFGFYDEYQSDSPRRSARIAQRHQYDKNNIPSQPSTRYTGENCQLSPYITVAAPGKLSFPSTPQRASRRIKKHFYDTKSKEISGIHLCSPINHVAQSSDLNNSSNIEKNPHGLHSAICNNGMLLTPAKTPSKKPTTPSRSLKAVARNIFPDLSATTEVQVQNKENFQQNLPQAFSGQSTREGHSKPFAIFTDSHDRIPEIEICPENPFFLDPSSKPQEKEKRPSQRRNVVVHGERPQSIEDLTKRNDGLAYFFRGKRIFVKFKDCCETSTEEDENEDGIKSLTSTPHRPLTRSSLRPRRLFPVNPKPKPSKPLLYDIEDEEADTDIDDEEADTDIEDEEADTEIEDSILSTPKALLKANITTPKSTHFAPVSPPTTSRTSRSKKLDMNLPPVTPSDEDNYESPSPITHNSRVSSNNKRLYPFYSAEPKAERPTKKRSNKQVIQSGTKERTTSR